MIRTVVAKLTGKTQSGDQWRYAWQQVMPDPLTGEASDPLTFASGGTSVNYALELNNTEVDTLDEPVVVLRQYGNVAGQMVWVFTAPESVSSWKQSVRAATTSALPSCTYGNGDSGEGATLTGSSNGALSAQDGVTLAAGEDLLVKTQSTAANNGIYTLTQLGDGSHPFILTRRADADSGGDLLSATVAVQEGTTNADTVWLGTANATITVGSTALPWVKIGPPTLSGSGTINSVPKWTAATTLGDSTITDDGTNVVVGAAFITVHALTGSSVAATGIGQFGTLYIPSSLLNTDAPPAINAAMFRVYDGWRNEASGLTTIGDEADVAVLVYSAHAYADESSRQVIIYGGPGNLYGGARPYPGRVLIGGQLKADKVYGLHYSSGGTVGVGGTLGPGAAAVDGVVTNAGSGSFLADPGDGIAAGTYP